MQLPDFLFDYHGEIRLTGHRIGLYTLVRDYQEGRTVEEIATEYPSLEPGLARKVIDFYLANPEEVNQYVVEFRAEMDRLEAAHPPSPEALKMRKLKQKIEEMDIPNPVPGGPPLTFREKLRFVDLKKLAEEL